MSDKKKQKETRKWVGGFLLELYHQQVISVRNNWIVPKQIIRKQFKRFLAEEKNLELRNKFLESNNNAWDIGSFLGQTNYLTHSPRGSGTYRIKHSSLLQYRNQKLEEYDVKRKNSEPDIDLKKTGKLLSNSTAKRNYEVDENAESYPIDFEGSEIQERNEDFLPTNTGCFICQQNFDSSIEFEEHVQDHGDDSDFKLLAKLQNFNIPVFQLSYQLCKNTHYFCFTMQSLSLSEIVIEKIIIVLTCSMYYVHNARVPYELPAKGNDTFFVDSHLFTIYLEQPIVIVFHYKNERDERRIEQHHFLRTKEFPVDILNTNQRRISNAKIFKPEFPLLRYLPSTKARMAMDSNFSVDQLSKISSGFYDYLVHGKTFTEKNIGEAMKTLLQVEDMITLRDYADLVQRNANFRKMKNKRFFRMAAEMKVAKNIILEEKIFPFDEVMLIPEIEQTTAMQLEPSMDLILRSTDDRMKNGEKRKRTTIFYGLIKRVSNRRITFESHTKVSENISYIIIFRPSRFTLRYQYRALELLDTMPSRYISRFLFPQPSFKCNLPNISLTLQNNTIYDNPEQLQAVQNIVDVAIKDAPYIIFGPPGTGKTTTIVEAILQLYFHRPNTKILVTAGSNSACNEIALRLCKVLSKLNDLRAIARIYSRSYEKSLDSTDELLLECSNFYSAHFYPDIELLHEYRIVVCTLNIVGKLALGNFSKTKDGFGIYTHVFVDEAAASTEAETLVGIIGILTSKSNLIISGDHKQLGPILSSERAAELGLEVSLMERLLKRECYAVDKYGNYDRSIQTRLCRNHRSHPEIVNLYNRLYYNNELKAMVNDGDAVSLCDKWHRSPNAAYPIIFHSVFGTATREGKSQSWYNQREVEVVMDYVKDLMYFGVNGQKITQEDIGIISPYKKQYLRIQEELNLRNWYKIETGSVEIFQGKEKTIIITSFVRSFTKTLGFLENPRRLNVTLSRPKSSLILIGNPKTLSLNADFKQIINECQLNNTLVGAAYHEHSKDAPENEKNMTNNTNKDLNVTNGVAEKTQAQQQLGKDIKSRVHSTSQETQRICLKHNSIPPSNDSRSNLNSPQSATIPVKTRESPQVSPTSQINIYSHRINSVCDDIDSLQKLLNSAYISRGARNLSTQSSGYHRTQPIINLPSRDNSLHTAITSPHYSTSRRFNYNVEPKKKSSWKCIIS